SPRVDATRRVKTRGGGMRYTRIVCVSGTVRNAGRTRRGPCAAARAGARIRGFPTPSGTAVTKHPLGDVPPPSDPLRAAITRHWLADETSRVQALLADARQPPEDTAAIAATAADLVRRVRLRARDQGVVESFMRQYDLGSEEGVLLMCVAEALLRIPDPDTTDRLIRDKLGEADWKRHVGQSESVLVNASTWGLMLTGHLVDLA